MAKRIVVLTTRHPFLNEKPSTARLFTISYQLDQEPSAITRAKAYLHAHYTEEVALHELARVAHLSPFYLARLFRQIVGLPPHAYQIQLRLARAKALLAQGFDVSYVAHETGFFDQSHFTRQFKQHFLTTPGNYQKTARFSK